MGYKVFVGSILVVVFVVMAIWTVGWLWVHLPS
jgi:hypothetical protein